MDDQGGDRGPTLCLESPNPFIIIKFAIHILSGILTGILTGILSGVLTGILSGVLTGILPGILTGIFKLGVGLKIKEYK